ncbi:MAG: hypothetical protein AB7O04_06310 [Hyphomonadaceae bacterium]
MQRFHPKVPQGTPNVEQMEVEFLRSVQFECDGRKQGPKFLKGKRYTFDRPFAERWIKRGAAFDVAGPEPEPAELEEEPIAGLPRGGASEGADLTGSQDV